MLNIIIGRAGTGKTNYIMNEIKRKMESGETGMILLVPEQYSHEAERQLCMVCGDALSLCAEVLSFTGLSRRVLTEMGKREVETLDSGGQILLMHRALEAVASTLKVFGIKKMRTEILERLLETVTELKTRKLTAKMLEKAATTVGNPLAEKIHDFALIFDAYNSMQKAHGGDALERLEILAGNIEESTTVGKGAIYFDGFNDFTAQELSVIGAMLKKNANITVCLTLDPSDDGEAFKLPAKTASELKRLAKKVEIYEIEENLSHRAPELKHLEKHLFTENLAEYKNSTVHRPKTVDIPTVAADNGQFAPITIYTARTRYEECSYAAATVRKLVEEGYRWRDIAVMARDWEEYSSICENVFEKYEIPYFSGIKTDILSKPPIALIVAALEIVTAGYEYGSVFKLLKTDLTDISHDEVSLLENYVIKWQIRGYYWQKEWKMPPSGYGRAEKGDDGLLERIDVLRKKILIPLENLRRGIKGESQVTMKLKALYNFLIEISLPERLIEKANLLNERGEKRLADEYTQLLDIIMSALDQMYLIVGDKEVNESEFKKLLTLVLSQQDVGVIPISLDAVSLGSMAMSRRRDLKALILIGATDDKLPLLTKTSGALSENERLELRRVLPEIPAGLEERYEREMNMLYSTLTLPSEKLYLIYPTNEGRHRSFIITNICKMYNLQEETLSEEVYMSAAEIPYRELLMRDAQQSTTPSREKLSESIAKAIYGDNIALSATRADRYYSCPYKHFLQNGLCLMPRTPVEFDAASAGNFIHFVLDGVFKEIKENSEYQETDEKCWKELTRKYCDKFVSEVLHDFEGKTPRFEYLFRRFEADVDYIVDDMLNELRTSKFRPLNLEMDISKLTKLQRGYIDRVDGYEQDGKLYLRVIDYKTRKQAYTFELSEVLRGRDMQMLVYLSVLQKYGAEFYRRSEIRPSGMLYVPARDVIISTSRNTPQEEIDKLRSSKMRRSGLVLDDSEIVEAMESGEEKRYLPVEKSRKKDSSGDFGRNFISEAQMNRLFRYVDKMMQNAQDEIISGVVDCKPYYKNESDNACNYCDYQSVCGFDEAGGDSRRYAPKLSAEEVWKLF
ncbi:MAG: PD-(D/E)XK nuclease family protein [Oscillospiraceae bacterium]|nr:PD-(D/E)XK nuclease family protein [Oscillospiraceae bacterium]MCL2278593.1 PD-(D/E)XK nuclease family protein [Oscillospiraceae bacterium]